MFRLLLLFLYACFSGQMTAAMDLNSTQKFLCEADVSSSADPNEAFRYTFDARVSSLVRKGGRLFLISEILNMKPTHAKNLDLAKKNFSFLDLPSLERASLPFLDGHELKSKYYYKQHPILTPFLISADHAGELSHIEILPTNLRAMRLRGHFYSGGNKGVCLNWTASPILLRPYAFLEIERESCGKFDSTLLLSFVRHQKSVDQYDQAQIQDRSRSFRPPNQRSPDRFIVRSVLYCGIDSVHLAHARRFSQLQFKGH